MTTYELPPEPPIGESVRDAYERTWKHEGVNRWALKDDDADNPDTRSWRQLFLSAPLTLIEPDPWPTAPLIVATFYEKRCVFGLDEDGNYDSPTGGMKACANLHRDSLTNVVPVTVVPVAEWEAMATTVRSLTAPGTKGSLLNQAQALVKATDALGVDL